MISELAIRNNRSTACVLTLVCLKFKVKRGITPKLLLSE
jgi:hypothetical protein